MEDTQQIVITEKYNRFEFSMIIDGQVVGNAIVIIRDGTKLFISWITINHKFRNRGLAKKLVKCIIDKCKHDYPTIKSIELNSVHNAYDFWRKIGFVKLNQSNQKGIFILMSLKL